MTRSSRRAQAVGEQYRETGLRLIRDARTIAVVDISADPLRPSHEVAAYLIDAGYEVYLVNPTLNAEVLGRRVYPSVASLPVRVDIVDVFRLPQHVPAVVADAVAAGAGAVWMQLRIVNEAAAATARAAEIEVVMDRCTEIDHGLLWDA